MGAKTLDSKRLARKSAVVDSFVDSAEIVLLQETHGGLQELRVLNMRRRSHRWFGTFSNIRAGGCIIGIDRGILSRCVSVEHVVLVPGRIHMVSLSCGTGSVNIYNVHIVPQWTIAEFRGALTSVSRRLREKEGGLDVAG